MKKTRLLMAASLTALLMSWSLPGVADPELLAGGDVRTRQGGIRVGTPRQAVKAVNHEKPPVAPTNTTVVTPPSPPPTSPDPVGMTSIPIPLPAVGLSRAEQAGVLADKLVGQGMATRFTGVGRVAGEMVEMEATNPTAQSLQFRIVPGMVLEAPAGSNVQPLILEDDFPITLAPGEHVSKRLNAYCLDYRVDPPAKGQLVDYHFAPSLSPKWSDPVRVLLAGLRLDSGGQFNPVLRPTQHRRVVIQRAIWEVLGQRQDATALRQAVQESSGNRITKRSETKIVDSLRKDMDRVIAESK